MVGSVFLAHQEIYNRKPKKRQIFKMRRWKKELEEFKRKESQRPLRYR